MATVQSVGGPGRMDESGLVDLLKTGMLMQQQRNKDQLDRKQGNDDLIKAGISSKTMRPAKDGEKSDFTDSSGRGWMYDDANLKAEHEQTTKLRQGQMWQNLVDQSYTAAQRNGLQYGTPDYNNFVKQYMAQALGSPTGKFDDQTQTRIEDTYGNQAISYMKSLDTSGSAPVTPQAVTPTPVHAGLMASLAGLFNGPVPGGAPMGNRNAPGIAPQMTFQTMPPPNMGAHGAPAGLAQGVNPDMQALMSLLAMKGQQPPMMATGPTQQQLGQ